MKCVRTMAALTAIGLFGHAAGADELAWKPSATPAPSAAASTAPAPFVPAAPVFTPVAPPPPKPAPTAVVEPAPAPPVQELSQWLPARRYPGDGPPKPSPPVPQPAAVAPIPTPVTAAQGVTNLASPQDLPITFRESTAEPSASYEVRPISPRPIPPSAVERSGTPEVFPPLQPLPSMPKPTAGVPVSTTVEQDPPVPTLPDVKPKSSDPLPAPRTADPPKPSAAPASVPTVTSAPAYCPPTLEPLPAGVMAGGPVAPVRNRVFGSPTLNLSRDYYFRDLFGTALPTEPRAVGVDGPFGASSDSFFVQTELLLWWANRPRIPVLATTSASGTGFGFVGNPDTRNLLGPGNFGPSFQTGFRIRAGGYLDDCGDIGLDGSFFFLGRGRERVVFDGLPVITRPFFAPNFNAEFGEVIARPGLSTGRFEVEQDSFLWGADLNYRCAVCRTCDSSRGWLLGYRHLNLTERLRMTEFITANGPEAPDPVGTQIVVGDRFETRNRFHGGQVGYWWGNRAGRFDVDARATLALGVTNSIVDIAGFQERTRPGEQTQSFVGGLLATGPNLGRFRQSAFSVVPEVTVNGGFLLSPSLRVYAGYNFLSWSNVLRPGDQIDRTVDVTFVPNPPPGVTPSGQIRPTVPYTRSTFWAQGVQFGLEFRW